MKIENLVRSADALRGILGFPAERAVKKQIDRLDEHCRAIIARSPFVLVASSDAEGRLDVSPKGDPVGFVQVLDDVTLAIPDRPGNRRADTFSNVLQNPGVGLLFMVPGRSETLRINGRAVIARDAALLASMAVNGKAPLLALVVSVEEAFVHCAKCVLRSRLWEPDSWPNPAGLPSHARCLLDQARVAQSLEEVQASVEESYRTGLY
jgi:PPOX class probable FMN-dependent enzyme